MEGQEDKWDQELRLALNFRRGEGNGFHWRITADKGSEVSMREERQCVEYVYVPT